MELRIPKKEEDLNLLPSFDGCDTDQVHWSSSVDLKGKIWAGDNSKLMKTLKSSYRRTEIRGGILAMTSLGRYLWLFILLKIDSEKYPSWACQTPIIYHLMSFLIIVLMKLIANNIFWKITSTIFFSMKRSWSLK